VNSLAHQHILGCFSLLLDARLKMDAQFISRLLICCII